MSTTRTTSRSRRSSPATQLQRSTTPASTTSRSAAAARRACSPRSATASSWSTTSGIVRLWNPAASAITGLLDQDVLGRNIAEVLTGWDRIVTSIPVGEAGSPARAETVPIEVDGRELWLSASGVGYAEGTVYAFRDLTEERALDELKSEFVATVSHELRTPLAAIYGAAQTIRRDDLELTDETHHELLGVIATESDRLAAIVNDLLLASHLDSGRLPVHIERCRSPRAGQRRRRERANAPAAGDRAAAERSEAAAGDRRRPRPAPAGAREPRRQRDQVLAGGRAGRRRARERRRRASASPSSTRASASPPPSTAGSSRSSTASIPT